jgi:hypothetical protein
VLTGLSIALQRRAMYPPGHPSLVPVLDGLARRLQALLDDRPRVAVGVARDQLVIEGVASDPATRCCAAWPSGCTATTSPCWSSRAA